MAPHAAGSVTCVPPSVWMSPAKKKIKGEREKGGGGVERDGGGARRMQFNLLSSRRKTRTNIRMWNLTPFTETTFRLQSPFDPCTIFFSCCFFFLSILVRGRTYGADFSNTVQMAGGNGSFATASDTLSTIILQGIQRNRSTAGGRGGSFWTAKLYKDMDWNGFCQAKVNSGVCANAGREP